MYCKLEFPYLGKWTWVPLASLKGRREKFNLYTKKFLLNQLTVKFKISTYSRSKNIQGLQDCLNTLCNFFYPY